LSPASELIAVSVTTRNYLHRTRVLMAGVARHLPSARRVVCLVDYGATAPSAEPQDFEIIDAATMGVPRFRQLAFALEPVAFCCALKPYLLSYAFERLGAKQVVYLDNDLRLYRPPDELIAALADCDLLLTPHLLEPLPSEANPSEDLILGYGTFNAGLIGATDTADTLAFLRWWGQRMATPRNLGVHPGYDQKWLEYAPSFLPRLGVLRHAGYNVASWNLASRPPTIAGDGLRIAGAPLTVFHFSSFDEAQPAQLIRSGLTCNYSPAPVIVALAEDYGRALEAAGAAACMDLGYGFSAFTDGRPISIEQRSYFRDRMWELAAPDADPFDPAFGLGGVAIGSLSRPSRQRLFSTKRWRGAVAALARRLRQPRR